MNHEMSARRPGGLAPRGRRIAGLGLAQLVALIFGFLITSALIFLFGIWVGRDITERRLAREERAVRMRVPEQPTPEAPKQSEVDLVFFETLKRRAEQRLKQTEAAVVATATPTAAAAATAPPRPPASPVATRPGAPPRPPTAPVATRPAAPPTARPTARPATPRPTVPSGPTRTPQTSASEPGEWADAGWTVQVSATTDKDQAAAIAARLRRQGYDAYTVESPMRGQTLYRVRVGRVASRNAAQELEGRLKHAGHENAYVTPR